MQEIGKFDVRVSVIPNGLEKYMGFMIKNSLVFFNSVQFKNYSLDSLVKNLTEIDFKYLSQEFSGDLLNIWTVSKSFLKKNSLASVIF